MSTWGYTLSPNAKAIYYRTDEDAKYFIRVIGKERAEIVLEDEYFQFYNLCDTGESYILGSPIYDTRGLYWCRTPIYYFNGSSIQVLTDRTPCGEMSYMPMVYYANNAPVIMFKQLKNIDSAEVEGFFIAVKNKIHYFGTEGRLYVFNDSGDRLWYIETHGEYTYNGTTGGYDFSGNHELYEVRITSEKLEPARLVDGDVSLIDLGFEPNGFETGYYSCFGNDLVYFKNSITLVEREWDKVKPIQSADMYIDGKLIDTDVVPTEVIYRKDKMCYITDWNVENESGTLTIYSNGAVKTIASKVNSFTEDNNKIYYITAWNGESGALIEYYNGIEKTIATEVKSVYKINGVVEYWCLNGDYKEINN